MKFRRWLALLVTTALALTLLTGCGASLPHPSTWTIENGTLYVPYGARTLTREQVEQVGRPFTGVALPATLREIGEGAFEGNTQLQRVQFGTEQADSPVNSSTGWIDLTGSGVALAGLFWDGGLTIGERAFYNCGSLSQVTGWGSSVSIGAYSFRGTNIYGSTDLSNVVYIGEYAFEDCWGITGQVSLHNAAYIGENAFAGCTGITGGLDLSSATSIGAGAFSGCTGLSGKIVMDKVETIGANAFEGCTGVTSVRYSQKAEVAENAFSGVSAVINGAPVAGGGGGGGGGSAPAVLTELTVDAGSAKTSYTEGDMFDPTGLTLTATYDDGTTGTIKIESSEDAKAKGVTWTPESALTAYTKEVKITYRGTTVNVSVEVEDVPITNLQMFINRIEAAKESNVVMSELTITLDANYRPNSSTVSTFLGLLSGGDSSTASGDDGNLTGTLDCCGATVVLTGISPLIKTINDGATLRNLDIVIEGSNDNRFERYGAAAEINSGTITGCTVTMNENSKIRTVIEGKSAGGIAGNNTGTIENCIVTMGRSSQIYAGGGGGSAGGIAGNNTGTINTCTVTINGKISANGTSGRAGGIAGCSSQGEIENCTGSGGNSCITASGSGGKKGNIVGDSSGTTISSCTWNGAPDDGSNS